MNWLQPSRFLGRLYSVFWICYNWLFSMLIITASSQLVLNWLLLAKKRPFQRVGRTFHVSCVGYKLAVCSIAIFKQAMCWVSYEAAVCCGLSVLMDPVLTGHLLDCSKFAIHWVRYKLAICCVGLYTGHLLG